MSSIRERLFIVAFLLAAHSSAEAENPSNSSCDGPSDTKGADACLVWSRVPSGSVNMHEKFSLELQVKNLGTLPAKHVSVKLWAQFLTFTPTSANYSCKNVANGIECAVDAIPAGGSLPLLLTAESFGSGKATITAALTADNDENPRNNEPRPFAQVEVVPAPVSESDATSEFLRIREQCVMEVGEDKLALRKCMSDRRDALPK